MDTISHSANADSILVLHPVLDLTNAEPLCRDLRQMLAAGEAIHLNGQAVERISTPCLQIIVATAIAAGNRGVGFQLRAASPALAAAITDLGLTTFIPQEA